MAVQTFTSGQVLTAADTNTFLANSGLVYVTSATVGSAVSSVTVSSAFSSTYDNYRIIYDGGSSSANVALNLQLGSTTSGYHYAYVFNQYSSTTPAGGGTTAGPNFDSVGRASTVGNSLSCDLYGPFLSQRTGCKYLGVDYHTSGFNVNGQGFLNNATSYTAFTFVTASGTITGGTITVYGYRKA
jgi:hypothetical protein